VGVLGVGLVDQTSPLDVPDYAAVRAAYTSDRTYVRAIEEQLPAQAAVFQMPYQVFPESAPVNGVADTEQLRLFLVSTDTRWSAGGLKGRPQADWPRRLAEKPTATAVRLLAVAGFSGVSLDRKALGPAAPQVEADVAAEVGGPPTATSPDRRFAYWPLDGVRREMERRHDDAERALLRQATLLPPVLYAPDLDEPVVQGGTPVRHSRTSDPELLLDNARRTPLAAHLSFAVASPTGATGVEVRLPGREPMTLDLTRGPAPVDVDLELPPGRSHVRLRLPPGARPAAPAADAATFDLLGLDLEDPILNAIVP
jgi:phosphoglycerol transferase